MPGELLFQVVRYEPKTFRQRRPNGKGGWHWSMKGVRRVPYRLPELMEAVTLKQTIFIAEGEKAVDTLANLGVPATCSPGGAEKWLNEYSEHLAGADVVILPDNDEPGDALACSGEGRQYDDREIFLITRDDLLLRYTMDSFAIEMHRCPQD